MMRSTNTLITSRQRVAAILVGCLLGISGCRLSTPELPPITENPTGLLHSGQVVWRDLVTADPQSSMAFYSEVFGWQFQASSEDRYTLILNQGRPIAGMVNSSGDDPEGSEARWVSFVSVEDVDRSLDALQGAGGSGHYGPVTAPGRGRLAVASDPQGAVIGLLRAQGGDPAVQVPGQMDWLWAELWSPDPDASAAFYAGLLGYEVKSRDIAGRKGYRIFEVNGEKLAGLMLLEDLSVKPYWLPYLRVPDAGEISRRAGDAGGKVIFQSVDGRLVLIADPQGGVVAAQVWTPPAEGE
jgi:predicted enzyme related to lactoylglutathione lyase